MDPLGDQLTTHRIQTDWEISIEPYTSWRFRCIDNLDHQWGDGSVQTRTCTWSDGPELLLTLSSRVVLCRQSWWQRWSFRPFKCHRTMMLKEWPGCCDDIVCIRNVSSGCHLLVFCARFLQRSTEVLAALPHLQKVVDLGHSVQFSSLCLSLHFRVVFCVHCIQCWVIACQYPVIGLSKLP